MVEISVSLLSVEQENYIKLFYDLETAKIDYFHIDVMDGKFVENNTEERMEAYASTIKNISNLPLDVHLMVVDVKRALRAYLAYEPNIITFHYEAIKEKQEILDIIAYLKQNNTKVGIAISPNTKIEEIFEYLPLIHMVLVMSVEPGKGKQKLIPETIEKIKQLKEYIDKNNIEIDIEVDGGINKDTVKEVKNAGANIIVSGSAITSSDNYNQIVEQLRNQ